MTDKSVCKFNLVPEIAARTDLTGNDKIVFARINSFSAIDLECYLSNQKIAKDCGISSRHAIRSINNLIQAGLVIKHVKDFQNRSLSTQVVTSCHSDKMSVLTECHKVVTKCHGGSDKMSVPPMTKCHTKNTYKEYKLEEDLENRDLSPDKNPNEVLEVEAEIISPDHDPLADPQKEKEKESSAKEREQENVAVEVIPADITKLKIACKDVTLDHIIALAHAELPEWSKGADFLNDIKDDEIKFVAQDLINKRKQYLDPRKRWKDVTRNWFQNPITMNTLQIYRKSQLTKNGGRPQQEILNDNATAAQNALASINKKASSKVDLLETF